MQNNRMFSQMLNVARRWLEGSRPEQIAANAKVTFHENAFVFTCLGKQITVSYPGYSITPQVDPWLELIILHYLFLADGTPLTGDPITFAQQKDGLVRGGGFDKKAEKTLSQIDYEILRARCKTLGGKEILSKADYSVQLPLLPMYPVTLNYWLADEEFPASGRLLLDRSAEHYLTIEDAVMAGEVLLQLLENSQQTVVKTE